MLWALFVKLIGWPLFLLEEITHTHLPTDLRNNTMTSWRQGKLHIEGRNTLCLCSDSNPEWTDSDLLIWWPTSIHQTLHIAMLRAEQNHQLVSKKISKVEMNWNPTLESQKKEELMYKNDASPGAKRASLWDRMDWPPGPVRNFLLLQGPVQLLRLNAESTSTWDHE